MKYKEEVKEFIIENFLFGDGKELTEETNFFDKGIIDSTGVLELICFMEETYDITIEDEDVTQKNFSTINNVSHYLQNKLPNNNSKI